MEPYLWKTRPDGVNIINIGKTWLVELEILEELGKARLGEQLS